MKPTIFGILLVALAGCTHDRVTADGLKIPEGLGKKLPVQQEDCRSSGIQFDALYVYKGPSYRGVQMYGWYRFWPNGRVLRRNWSPSQPTAYDGDDFSHGDVGRYCVVGRDVTMEFYERPGDDWLFRTYGGTLDANGDITLDVVRWKTPLIGLDKSLDFAEVCKKRVVGEMRREPEW